MYRVHPANESLETLLDINRPVGWQMTGEESPGGVAVCADLEDLAGYACRFGMNIKGDDVVVSIKGRITGDGHDDIDFFVVADSYTVVGSGAEFMAAMALSAAMKNADVWTIDMSHEDIAYELDNMGREYALTQRGVDHLRAIGVTENVKNMVRGILRING